MISEINLSLLFDDTSQLISSEIGFSKLYELPDNLYIPNRKAVPSQIELFEAVQVQVRLAYKYYDIDKKQHYLASENMVFTSNLAVPSTFSKTTENIVEVMQENGWIVKRHLKN